MSALIGVDVTYHSDWAISGPLCSIRSGHAFIVYRGLDEYKPKRIR